MVSVIKKNKLKGQTPLMVIYSFWNKSLKQFHSLGFWLSLHLHLSAFLTMAPHSAPEFSSSRLRFLEGRNHVLLEFGGPCLIQCLIC